VNGWLQHENHPSVMANSTENKQAYGSLAMTAAGKAFAVVTSNITEIQSWQVGDDMVDWTSVGVVDIGNAWS
jgi:VCBS repeat-containing protein